MSSWNLKYGEECIIARNNLDIEVRTPAFPTDCDYVRVVWRNGECQHEDGSWVRGDLELAYWTEAEWVEAGAEVMGAIMAVVKQVNDGHNFEVEIGFRAFA